MDEPLCDAQSVIYAGWDSFVLECTLPAGHEPVHWHEDPEHGVWEDDPEW